uniref:Ig-like domain-containing protein n=1 Tax=Oreochromis aureus TaxID=47969 RepID=A0AAZ1X4D0_OREAU
QVLVCGCTHVLPGVVSRCILTFNLSVLFPLSDQKNITATPGQKSVTLPCRAPNNNNNIVVLEWSRADLGEKYVLLSRDEQLDPENQHPSFKNRVELLDRQMKDGDVSLILKDVTTTDNGTYECRRAVLDGDPISSITLSVVDPPVLPKGKSVGLKVVIVLFLVSFLREKKNAQHKYSQAPR